MVIDNSEAVKVHSSFGYKDYYWATKSGKVYKVTEDKDKELKIKEMSPFTTKDGYIEYVLTNKEGKKKHKQGQLIILTSFKGPKPGYESNHKDTNRANNKLSNLEWLTPSQNIKHSFDNGKVVWNKGKKKQPDGSFK
jgi:hypothetical protein